MRRTAIFLALTLALPAHAFEARNGLSVTPTGPQEFTVDYKSKADLTDYWCAAGDYAGRVLGASTQTRVYRVSPEPRRAGQGISFSLDSTKSAGETGLTSFGGKNDGAMSAGGSTTSFCTKIRYPVF